MKNIFIIGAGLSTPCLIKYLAEKSEEYNWTVTVGDISKEQVEKRLQGLSRKVRGGDKDAVQQERLLKAAQAVLEEGRLVLSDAEVSSPA